MSDYGPPPGSPVQGPPPGQPSYGPPGGGYGQPQQGAKAPKAPMDRSAVLGYAAAGLGLLNFIWGFLHWLTVGNNGVSGYASLGQAVVGLSLAAGLVAAASVLEKKSLGTVPAALAVAAALVALGIVISHDAYNTDVGLILAFITALVQAGVCVYAYLESRRGSGSGLSLGSGHGGSSGGSSSGSAQSSGGYGSTSYGGGPGGSTGPGGLGGGPSYAPPAGPGGYEQQPGYGQPAGYGQPGYEQQGYEQQGGPSFEPPAHPHPGPGAGAHAAPQGPAEGGGGGRETTVIPRFPTPPSEAQDPATQQFPAQGDRAQGDAERSGETQHIPRFDPPPNPYAQPPGEQR